MATVSPDAPRTVSDDAVGAVIDKTWESTPEGCDMLVDPFDGPSHRRPALACQRRPGVRIEMVTRPSASAGFSTRRGTSACTWPVWMTLKRPGATHPGSDTVERLRQILARVPESGLTDHHTRAFLVQVTPTNQNGDYSTLRGHHR